jgi:glycosyltransferase involved in cell wall biosynthesis
LEEYRQLGIPDVKVRIIPNGCDSAKFAAIKRDNDKICELRRKYGAEDKKIILTTGRYHPKKGFDRIPEIAAYLKKSGMDFIWIIAGKGNGVILEQFPDAENLGIICVEDVVSSKGVFSLPPDSLIELYCMADIYVFPTLIETFGMVLVEAMAAGLPIVTTDAPGVRDVIEDGVNGVKVPVNDTSALAEKTAEILSDETRYRELSDNVLAMAADKYDWKVVTGHYIDFYRSLTGK